MELEIIIIAALSLSIYIISLRLIAIVTGGLSFISPVHVYAFFYTTYIYIWILVQYLNGVWSTIGSVSLPPYDFFALAMATAGMLSFAIGSIVTASYTKFRPNSVLDYWRRTPIENDLSEFSSKIAIFILFLLGMSLASIFFIQKGFPILAYLQAIGSPNFFQVMSKARAESLTGSGYLMQGVTTIMPISTLLIFGHSQISDSRILRIITGISIIILITLMFSLTSRGHFAMFIILLFLSAQCLQKKKIRWSTVGFWFCLILILFAASSFLKFGLFENIESVWFSIKIVSDIFFKRLELGAQQLRALFIVIPKQHEFLIGQGFLWDLTALLPGPNIGFNRWAFNQVYPSALVPANITPTSIGEWYSNFGIPGIIIFSFCMGALLQAIHQVLLRNKAPLSLVIFIIFYSSYLAKCAMNGIGAMLEPIASGTAAFLLFYILRALIRFSIRSNFRSRNI